MATATRPSSTAVMRSLSGLMVREGVTSSMLPITITFEPTILISTKRIDKLGVDIRSFKEPLTRVVREVIIPSIRQNFAVGGRPAWAPLSAGTLAKRAKDGVPGSQVLIKTGALRRVATQLNIWTIGQNTAMVRDLPSNVWYGAIHQGGSEAGSFGALARRIGHAQALERVTSGNVSRSSPIPARPFIVLQDEDLTKIDEIFWEWFQQRIDRAWPAGV